jgi:hypothetical protein
VQDHAHGVDAGRLEQAGFAGRHADGTMRGSVPAVNRQHVLFAEAVAFPTDNLGPGDRGVARPRRGRHVLEAQLNEDGARRHFGRRLARPFQQQQTRTLLRAQRSHDQHDAESRRQNVEPFHRASP